MPVGIFPTLVPPKASGNTEFHTWEIPLGIVPILLESNTRKGINLIVLLRRIWAIVLGQCVESDWLCFKLMLKENSWSKIQSLVSDMQQSSAPKRYISSIIDSLAPLHKRSSGPHDASSQGSHPPASANIRVYESISKRCAGQPSCSGVCAWDGEFAYEQLISSRQDSRK
ncbi:nonribosomal peptide synthetase [Aspergillus luchuensis]|uniref:Nonribosomal peptide synthetase n=1 Tax=Aspergillus kawachii TaxID=1069201 RepID=A0A146F846_ASPKA|nr:nonribosomal peptide synthetase [Aspergillus luchuensis]